MTHSHSVLDMDKHFIIDPITRTVTNAESKKTLLMQNDHNSERFSFEIDKVVEGHDMTLCNKVEIHYTNFDMNNNNSNPGVYEVDDVEISADDPNKLIFTWLISQNATVYNGSLRFLVVFACVENGEVTYRWNSGVNNSITIAKGLNNGEAIEGSYPDILNQWKNDLFAAVFGMKALYVGPEEPDNFPYIWFDTSEYYGVSENDIAKLTIKDADGNKVVLYPTTKIAGTDAPNLVDTVNGILNNINEISGDVDAIRNDVTSLENADSDIINDVKAFKENNDQDHDDIKLTLENHINEMNDKEFNIPVFNKVRVLLGGNGWLYSDYSGYYYTEPIVVEGLIYDAIRHEVDIDTDVFYDPSFYPVYNINIVKDVLKAWSLVDDVIVAMNDNGETVVAARSYRGNPGTEFYVTITEVRYNG